MKLMAKRDQKTVKANRTSKPISLRLDPALLGALDQFIGEQKYKTTKTDVIEVALQELLKAEGRWPPKKE
jgi:hypothetical protein